MVAERRDVRSASAWRSARIAVLVLTQVMKQGLVLTAVGVVVVGLARARFEFESIDHVVAVWCASRRSGDDGRGGGDDHASRGVRMLAASLARLAARSERGATG